MAEPESVLGRVAVEDVWGIGSRLALRLRRHSVHTAWDLRNADDGWIRQEMGIVGLRLVHELRGIPCLPLELCPPPKQGIASSRSFRTPVVEREPLRQAVATFTARGGEKLRSQASLARSLAVYLMTNPFEPRDSQYYNSATVAMPVATCDTGEMIHYALQGLEAIFRPGFRYKKAGVMVQEIVPEGPYQANFFDDRDRGRRRRLMRTMDRLNARMGAGTVRHAVLGIDPEWRMRQAFLTPSYTTRWDHLPLAQAE